MTKEKTMELEKVVDEDSSLFKDFINAEVQKEYPLKEWVAGLRVGKPTRKDNAGNYRVPVTLANGPERLFEQYSVRKKPKDATSFKLVPSDGEGYGLRVVYIKR